jgi:hypothetical protein
VDALTEEKLWHRRLPLNQLRPGQHFGVTHALTLKTAKDWGHFSCPPLKTDSTLPKLSQERWPLFTQEQRSALELTIIDDLAPGKRAGHAPAPVGVELSWQEQLEQFSDILKPDGAAASSSSSSSSIVIPPAPDAAEDKPNKEIERLSKESVHAAHAPVRMQRMQDRLNELTMRLLCAAAGWTMLSPDSAPLRRRSMHRCVSDHLFLSACRECSSVASLRWRTTSRLTRCALSTQETPPASRASPACHCVNSTRRRRAPCFTSTHERGL